MAQDSKKTNYTQLQLKQYEEKIRELENQNDEIKNDLINKTIGIYQITNDRLNTHISYISLISTIFGLIIAIGGVWIGYESIRSRKRTEQAIKTLEEAKKYVENKKEEFDESVHNRLEEIEIEFKEVLVIFKEQLVSDINRATDEVKTLAETKTQEIQNYSVEKKSDEALEGINRRISFFENIGIPDDPKILLSKAKLLDEKEMYNEAIELLEKLIKQDPKNSKGYWQLGWEFSKKSNQEKSIENYKMCIQLDPNNAAAHNNLGVALERSEKYDEALKAYEMAISTDKGNERYHINKAITLAKIGKLDESITTYKNAITLLPNEEKLYNYILSDLRKLERFEEMFEYYDLAIKNIEKKSQYYNFDKASLLAQRDKTDEAIQILTYLAEQNYKTGYCYLKIADIKLKQGKAGDGITVLDKAISMDPKNGHLYIKKAELLIKDNKEQAYETIIDGHKHIKEESYLSKGARIFSGIGDNINARKLYNISEDIIKSKFIENKDEPSLMEYYETLLITEKYDDADSILNEHKDIIKTEKYNLVLRVLNLYRNIMRNIPINFEYEITYYKDISITDKIDWIFDDILYLLKIDADEKNYKLASSITQLLTKKINKDEFEKIKI